MSDSLKVVEFAGLGPVPFCSMLLAASGAEVTRISRPRTAETDLSALQGDILLGGRAADVELDLKSDEGRIACLRICEQADILLEGFRPGTMERLGLGPDEMFTRNPRLVYGRVTGFGQTGPAAAYPGHDINYIAETGALSAIGKRDAPPAPPLNLVADFGGGGLYAAYSVLAALHAARLSGEGRVLDISMQDGVALQMAMTYGMHNQGLWTSQRESNLLDGGAPFYRCYATSDGGHVAVGALEPRFFAALLDLLDLSDLAPPDHLNPDCWDQLHAAFGERFLQRTRDDWCGHPLAAEACLTPVFGIGEAASSGRVRMLSEGPKWAARLDLTRLPTTGTLGDHN